MKFTAALLAALTAVVMAAPDWPKCHGDMEWDPIEKLCKCDKGEHYDPEVQSCRISEVQAFKVRSCSEKKALYCVRNEKEFIPYDAKHPFCFNDHHSKVVCAESKKVTEVFKLELHKSYERIDSDSTELEVKRQSCLKPRLYNYETTDCECPRNKHWDGKTCSFPVISKPLCPIEGQKAFCAKSENHIAAYSKHETLCKDNGKNYVFCCGSSEAAAEKKKKAATCLRKAISAY